MFYPNYLAMNVDFYNVDISKHDTYQCIIFISLLQSESPSGAKLNALGVYLLVSLFFVCASFIEFGILLLLKRTYFLGERGTLVDKTADVDNQKNQGSHIEKAFDRRLKRAHDIALQTRYSIADKIDFGSFIFFMFAYVLFNVGYIIQYAN